MVGAKTGVATHISKIESHVHSTHCHGHALQLAVGETIKAIEMRGTLDTVFELNKDNWVKTLHQETLVAEHCAQIVGLSEGHCCKPF